MKIEIEIKSNAKPVVTITTERGTIVAFADMSNTRTHLNDIMRRRVLADIAQVVSALAAIDGLVMGGKK